MMQYRYAKVVTVRPLSGGEDVPEWGAGTAIRAQVLPNGGEWLVRMYGERAARMAVLFVRVQPDGRVPLAQGDGVSGAMADGNTGACDARVIQVDVWHGHARAVLEWIPENRRGTVVG